MITISRALQIFQLRLVTAKNAASTAVAGAISKPFRVTFVGSDNEVVECRAADGDNLLDIAHANNVDLEGACEASLACSTCHVIVEDVKFYDRIPAASDEENDMLDLAFGLTETSRLGCQVRLCRELDGIRVRIPSATRNMAIDGYKPKPH